MQILLIDNYDSFTYNLVQLLYEAKPDVDLSIFSNDQKVSDLPKNIDKVLISPGPGLPQESGNLMPLISKIIEMGLPMLGVCLGHQAIAMHFGASLKQLNHSSHGIRGACHISQPSAEGIFEGFDNLFYCGRYHSWVVDSEHFPDCLTVSAIDNESNIMAIQHIDLPIWGVQFHPESYMTENGLLLIKNWLTAP